MTEPDWQIEYGPDGPLVLGALGADWRATYVIRPQGIELVVTEVRVAPLDALPKGGLSARLLRDLRPGEAVRRLRADIAGSLRDTPVRLRASPEVVAALANDPRWIVAFPGSRPMRPWADVQERLLSMPAVRSRRLERLADTAARYVEALDGGARSPGEVVARAQRRPVSQDRDDLRAARHAGLLSAAPARGRAGGSLTELATALLDAKRGR